MLKYSLPVSNFHHCFALTIYVDLGREEMKLQQISYARSINNNNAEYDRRKKNPSFGNLAVGLATFIENNGFLGEFLTIDTCGMMIPRTGQGYLRNREELGHLNYKAGQEEAVRELLSGPSFFYVPLAVITLAGLLRGKAAKVQTKVLEGFKSVMKKTNVNLKDANATKNNFVDTVINKAFGDYKNEIGLVDRLKDLMKQNLQKGTKKSDIRKEADKVITKLNKANGRFLDNASTIKLGDNAEFNIKDFFQDMSNYLDDFTNKAQKTDKPAAEFIELFHKKAKDLRNITNIMAVSALSAFLMLVPKLYQTSKKFPGKDGLNTGETNDANNAAQAAQAPKENQVKEAV